MPALFFFAGNTVSEAGCHVLMGNLFAYCQ